MTTIHDSGYKRLFSNTVFFRQLLETFVDEPWVREIDFSQCETLDKSFISEHYKETESDIIYKVRLNGREAYLVILLEFQSTVDRFMALRMLNYLTNFYMDYVESQSGVSLLPPVFPLVLYNGDRRWTAPVSLAELIQEPQLLGKYVPQFEYFKLVEHEYGKDELLRIRNLVSTLFLTEAHYDRELVIDELLAVFQREENRQAASLLMNWYRQLYVHDRVPSADYDEFERVYHTVEEVNTMLVTALEKEREQFRAEGRQEGWQEGEKSGEKRGLSKGELIGEIRATQKFLKRPVTPTSALTQKSLTFLKGTLKGLETELAEFN